MSEEAYDPILVFIPNVEPRRPGKNHVLSRNPLTTLCGRFKRGGHDPAQHDAPLCGVCERLATGERQTGLARPLRDNFKGARR